MISYSRRTTVLALLSGLLVGICGVLLSVLGNPENSGICVSCFIENSAGALGLHANERLQYLRPELLGFLLGAFIMATTSGEFRSRGGGAPLVRLFTGMFLIVGCATFIGCPIKLLLRLTAGDLTAVPGLLGLIGGVRLGIYGFANGVELPGSRLQGVRGAGLLLPASFVFLLVLFVTKPQFLAFGSSGSSAQHAPWLVALGIGLLLGAVAQRSRFCITGGLRDLFLMGLRSPLSLGLIVCAGGALLASLATGRFQLGLTGQPGAHNEYLWSFLGMGLVGWLSALAGGCPFRQLVKAGEGDTDSGLAVIGMFLGGAVVQAWDLTATTAGVPVSGRIAVLVGLFFVAAVSLACRQRAQAATEVPDSTSGAINSDD
ncbi:MAG TPA: YedE family putative selenium transporter [Geobacteraceae bacterium]